MIPAILGALAGLLLGALFVFLWMRAKNQADSVRLSAAESRLVSLEEAAAAKIRAESLLEQFRESSERELAFAQTAANEKAAAVEKAHCAELEALKQQQATEMESARREYESNLDGLNKTHAAELNSAAEKAAAVEKAHCAELEALRKASSAELEAARTAQNTMQTHFKESMEQLENVTKERTDHLRQEFKVLSESILKERTAALQSANKEQLDAILAPLKEKMAEYKTAIESAEKNGVKLNETLKNQYDAMVRMTEKIGTDANNLARALKGQNKTQGDWGEMILETILKNAGLVNGVHYETQTTMRTEGGELIRGTDDHFMRPDVIVHYPDGKDVIIDSKVSLTAFTDYVNASSPEAQKAALERHVRSVRAHVEELAVKNYPAFIKDHDAIDFVIMFIPNEPPHQAVMMAAPSLWREAFDKHVLIVSPVNLMALLQMIRVAWTRAEQEKNQKDILDTATRLLDRVYNFYEAFDDVGRKLTDASKNYEKAAASLRGRQSIAGSAKKLADLGVSPKKPRRLPDRFSSPDLPGVLPSGDAVNDADTEAEPLSNPESNRSDTQSELDAEENIPAPQLKQGETV